MSANNDDRIRFADNTITPVRSRRAGVYPIRQDPTYALYKRDVVPSEKSLEFADGGDERDIRRRQEFGGKYLLW